MTCPACGYAAPNRRRVAVALANVGTEWRTVRTGASRWYVHKLRAAYPAYEWRTERLTLTGGADSAWRIDARRRG